MGKRILVHCHAGTGRTALVIASYLYYSGLAYSGPDAVEKVKTQRPGSLGRKTQVKFVLDFCQWLDHNRRSLFPDPNLPTELTYLEMMNANQRLCHGKDIEDFKYYPKFLGLCLRSI